LRPLQEGAAQLGGRDRLGGLRGSGLGHPLDEPGGEVGLAGPEIAGWVNYRNKVYPVFKDPGGAFYLDDDGWASTRHYPLIRGEDEMSGKPSGFRF